jgi:phospholipase/carboxylesterase
VTTPPITRSSVYIDVENPQLAPRAGLRPLTTRPNPDLAFPHQQLTQTGPTELGEVLVARGALLPGVEVRDSCVSVPGARAFHVAGDLATGPPEAYQCQTEFAHVHPAGDGSLHMTLPPRVYDDVIAKGWGEPHPISGTMLVFGPRNRRELEIIWQLVVTSYRYAVGHVSSDDETGEVAETPGDREEMAP